MTTTTTTMTPTFFSAAWTFDQTPNDSYGVYNGALMNTASYSAASASQPYIGYGRALSLSASSNQSFMVSAPFLNLTYTSFTIEAWIYSTNITNDRGIFSQCACSTCSNQCFYFIVRSGRLYADFTFNGFSGATTISMNIWYHVAFVYDYGAKQQILYLNGVQDGVATSIGPYQGTNASIQIGAAIISAATFYFNGYIDNVKLTTRAKSSTELLFAASITAYYPFDFSSLNNDNGPNGMNGSSTNTAMVIGRVNQAIHFSGSSSYFQAFGFYRLAYSVSNLPFSVSLWINPSSLSTSTIIQVSTQQMSTPGFNFLGIMSAAGTTGQIMVEVWAWPSIYGPFITANTWTHVSATYSSTNGITLYVNGTLYGSTGACGSSTSGFLTWLQIGYNFACSGSVSNGGYYGSVDEVYVHSRELTQADVTALANP